MDSIKEISLTKLLDSIEEAHAADKTAFFYDTTSTADRFFTYSGKIIECAKMQIQKAMGGKTIDQIKEDY